MIGQNFKMILDVEEINKIQEYFKARMEDRPAPDRHETVMVNKNGNQIYVEAILSNIKNAVPRCFMWVVYNLVYRR
ncbi:MAG: PAS domain S-box protein [Calditrichaeota bacterium]|nr:PAS domain S-box protein [Calditrichota bacterium]